jgi:hypothetical protein
MDKMKAELGAIIASAPGDEHSPEWRQFIRELGNKGLELSFISWDECEELDYFEIVEQGKPGTRRA